MSSNSAKSIVQILKDAGIDLFTMFPCEKVRRLYDLITMQFKHMTLSREEEGIGICAGASLAGARPAMLIQSSGIGNMVNALCSLTITYKLPLLILVSWRGVYKEKIQAQIHLGKSLPGILRSIGIHYIEVKQDRDIPLIGNIVGGTYRRNSVEAVLLNPAIWKGEEGERGESSLSPTVTQTREYVGHGSAATTNLHDSRPLMTRFEILKAFASFLDGKAVVCNLGIPCKELYAVKHQKSNFYMLGSMGLASSIGLGISEFTSKEVVAIEGDGSILTNLGALSTIAVARPKNLTILAIDNGVHGSTGNQPTATSICVDLEVIARGLGFKRTYKAKSREEVLSVINNLSDGPSFVHLIAKPGNAKVPEVPLSPVQIKRETMGALSN